MTERRHVPCRDAVLLAACVAGACILGAPVFAGADPPGWSLVWSDKFDRLDTSKWTLVDTDKPTNNSLQDYLPRQVSVRRGKLIIVADDTPSRGLGYRSGQVVSKAEQKYGRWEVRAKMPTTRGMWPAIWLLPDTDRYPWPSGGEIDIVENRGNQPKTTSSAFHFGAADPYKHDFVYREQMSMLSRGLADYHRAFHTYAVDWTEDRLRFYVDGVNHLNIYDDDVDGFLSQSTEPMRLVINNAIGGDFLPDPDDTTDWPQKMEVDWVKVYEPAPETFTASLVNGDFESYGGALYGWSVFGNRVVDGPNVGVTAHLASDGTSALKLFGAFAEGGSYSGVSQGVTVAGGERVVASLKSFAPAWDSIAGSDNTVSLKIEFYSDFGSKYGSSAMIGEESTVVVDGDSPPDRWRSHELVATAPDGAAEARIAIVFHQPTDEPGAVFCDEASLVAFP